MQNIGYKGGYYREYADGSCFWQLGVAHGKACSIHAAKIAITKARKERAHYYALDLPTVNT